MTKTELLRENERLKRLVRFQYLILGYYGTEYNYNDGKFLGGMLEDQGRQARQCKELTEFLGFKEEEISNTFPGPWTCSNCNGSLKYKNMFPCECDLPEVAGICKKDFRKW